MKKVIRSFSIIILFVKSLSASAQINITYSINTSLERKSISPYIYGINCNLPNWSTSQTENIAARRMGGNRLTPFNWEHNYSNAGADFVYSNDLYLFQMLQGVSAPTNQNTGEVLKIFHDTSLAVGAYSLVTVPMAGKVSGNTSGTGSGLVNQNMNATKGSAFTLTPNKTDGQVYADEMVNWLVNQYGNASTTNGVKGYSLDNEPDLWSSTHQGWYGSTGVTCAQLIQKSTDFSKGIKSVDPNAEVFGFVSYGYSGYRTLQSASDWNSASFPSATYPWFIDAYLDKMKAASVTAGKRLIDVLDLHYYTEHQGRDNSNTLRRVWDESNPSWENHTGVAQARIQAPRSLWDPNFVETSWITQFMTGNTSVYLIPTLNTKISNWWSGTKLGFSEWSFSGEGHISGGLAVADALGIYGKYDVYFSSYWGDIVDWISAGFKLYRNYDGSKSTFENTHVKAEPGAASDWSNTSIYASVNNATDNELHLIVLNKHWTSSIAGTFNITSGTTYTTAKIYGFNSTTSNISLLTTISNITGNSFTYTIPALTALHIVLEDGTLPVELKSFTGKVENNQVELVWAIASEEEMKGYEIYRSATGNENTWEKIGFLEATNFKDFDQKYFFYDQNSSARQGSYYKIECIEKDLSVKTSSIIYVNAESDLISAYPNPFTEGFTVMPGNNTEEVKVIIRDSSGKVISEQVSSGGAELYFSTGTLLPGIYFTEVIRTGEVKIIKMIRN